jgi:MFS family permease
MTRPSASSTPTTAYGARDLLANRSVLVDTVAPPVVFVLANAVGGLGTGAAVAIGFSLVLVAARLLRRQRLLYALSGLGGTLIAVGFALVAGEASAYFLPGIVSNAVLGIVSVVSILVRRPVIALTSAAIYRWPLQWYWHPRVRPAYSEITWAWATLYLGKAAVQWILVQRQEVGWLTVSRIATGWPAFAALLLVTYAYVTWRLERLGGPSVDEYRRDHVLAATDRPSSGESRSGE